MNLPFEFFLSFRFRFRATHLPVSPLRSDELGSTC